MLSLGTPAARPRVAYVRRRRGLQARPPSSLNAQHDLGKAPRFRFVWLASTSQDTISNRSYALSANSERTARAFAIALSLAIDSSAAKMVRTCSSPVADRRSLTENAVLRVIRRPFFHTLTITRLDQAPLRSYGMHDRCGDGFLLGCMQPRQSTVANVVIGNVTAGVIEQSSNTVLGHPRRAANSCVSSTQGVVCEHPVPGQAVAPHMTNRTRKNPTLGMSREEPSPDLPGTCARAADKRRPSNPCSGADGCRA
jgi:hypothetical protein